MNKKLLLKISIIIVIVIAIITVIIIFINTHNNNNKIDLRGAKMLLRYSEGTTWFYIYLYDNYAICRFCTSGDGGFSCPGEDKYLYKDDIQQSVNSIKQKEKDNIIYTGGHVYITFEDGDKQYNYDVPENDEDVNKIINNILNYNDSRL